MSAERARRRRGEGGISPYMTSSGQRFSIVYRAYDPRTQQVRQFRQRASRPRRPLRRLSESGSLRSTEAAMSTQTP